VTVVGKIALALSLTVFWLSTGFVAWGIHVGVTKRLVQGAGAWGILALIAAVGVVVLDFTFRWTRQAARELREPLE